MSDPAPPALTCLHGTDSRTSLPIFDGMTLGDLRDVLFSVTDIPPDTLHITLPSGATFPPSGPPSASTPCASAGILPGGTVTASAAAPRAAAPVISLADLSAALSGVSSSSASPRGLPPAGETAAGRAYVKRLRVYRASALEYERPRLQARARALVPLDALRARAAGAGGCADAALARELLAWFKGDFFEWVNAPACWACQGKTRNVGVVEPSISERKHRAGVVEMYECVACGAVQRFARFNDPAKLLETRRGRCGEWAQAFTLVARACGLTVRVAHDETDHVWTEIWSGGEQRWLHADSCEACLDQPLLYEEGWGKKLSYVVAVGCGTVADVTRRYSNKYEDTLTRRGICGEQWLAARIVELDAEAVAELPVGARDEAARRNAGERAELLAKGKEAGAVDLPGRTSGATEWVRARGEDGGNAGDGARKG